MNKQAIGNRIKEIRINNPIKKNATMEEFAEMVDSNKSNVSRWERGKNIPNEVTLRRIAELGNISVNELLYGPSRNYYFKTIKDNENELSKELNVKSISELFDDFYEDHINILTNAGILEEGEQYYPSVDSVLEYFRAYVKDSKKQAERLQLALNLFYSKEALQKLIEPLKDGDLKNYLIDVLKYIEATTESFENYFDTKLEDEISTLNKILKENKNK